MTLLLRTFCPWLLALSAFINLVESSAVYSCDSQGHCQVLPGSSGGPVLEPSRKASPPPEIGSVPRSGLGLDQVVPGTDAGPILVPDSRGRRSEP